MKIKNLTGRLNRWAMVLQAYDIQIVHKLGKFNAVPDAISRLQPTVSVTTAGGYDPARIAKLQRSDPQIHQLITFLESGEPYHIQVAPELAPVRAHDFF